MRASELYLIRAEARIQQNKIAAEGTNEMFMEGHPWFNLKRWKGMDDPALSRADELMPAILANKAGGTWQPYLKLFPVSEREIEVNPNMVQTPGF